jgi:hypothetical protein
MSGKRDPLKKTQFVEPLREAVTELPKPIGRAYTRPKNLNPVPPVDADDDPLGIEEDL